MKNFNKKLAVMILKNTTAFKLNHISYKIDDDGDSLVVWSNKTLYGNFSSTEIIHLFRHPFSNYIYYNSVEGRCQLRIF